MVVTACKISSMCHLCNLRNFIIIEKNFQVAYKSKNIKNSYAQEFTLRHQPYKGVYIVHVPDMEAGYYLHQERNGVGLGGGGEAGPSLPERGKVGS